jgi:hypothetical protein
MKPTKEMSECGARRRHHCCPLWPTDSASPFKGQLTSSLHYASLQRKKQKRDSLRPFAVSEGGEHSTARYRAARIRSASLSA